jgi:fido (protein-threonine AMPylation protein)
VTDSSPYGNTPLEGDELDFLLASVRERVALTPTKRVVFDLEQGAQVDAAKFFLRWVIESAPAVTELLSPSFITELHRSLYGEIWAWAGKYRRHEVNIGVQPHLLANEVVNSLTWLTYRWQETQDWDAKQFALATHAELLRVHPFHDGNGRTFRLLADLVFTLTQDSPNEEALDWNVDRQRYIALLKEFDQNRDPTKLAEFVTTEPWEKR